MGNLFDDTLPFLDKEDSHTQVMQQVKKQKFKISKAKGLAALLSSIGIGTIYMSHTPNDEIKIDDEKPVVIPDNPMQADNINDTMSFTEAFTNAREELGAGGFFVWRGNKYGTYYDKEWENIDIEDKKEFYHSVINQGHYQDNETEDGIRMPEGVNIAMHVSEGVSFNDAFAIARDEIGAGGVFQWNGRLYSTYYNEEWNNMTKEEKNMFEASALTANKNEHDFEIVNLQPSIEVGDNSFTHPHDECFLGDKIIKLGEDESVHIGLFESNGQQQIRADFDENGSFNHLFIDNDSSYIDLNNNFHIYPFGHVDSFGLYSIYSENIQLDRHHAILTSLSDGSHEIKFHTSNLEDYKIKIEAEKHWIIYNSQNEVINNFHVEENYINTHESAGDYSFHNEI